MKAGWKKKWERDEDGDNLGANRLTESMAKIDKRERNRNEIENVCYFTD